MGGTSVPVCIHYSGGRSVSARCATKALSCAQEGGFAWLIGTSVLFVCARRWREERKRPGAGGAGLRSSTVCSLSYARSGKPSQLAFRRSDEMQVFIKVCNACHSYKVRVLGIRAYTPPQDPLAPSTLTAREGCVDACIYI